MKNSITKDTISNIIDIIFNLSLSHSKELFNFIEFDKKFIFNPDFYKFSSETNKSINSILERLKSENVNNQKIYRIQNKSPDVKNTNETTPEYTWYNEEQTLSNIFNILKDEKNYVDMESYYHSDEYLGEKEITKDDLSSLLYLDSDAINKIGNYLNEDSKAQIIHCLS